MVVLGVETVSCERSCPVVPKWLSGIERPSFHQPSRQLGPFCEPPCRERANLLTSAKAAAWWLVTSSASSTKYISNEAGHALTTRKGTRSSCGGHGASNLLTSAKAAACGSARHSAQMDVPPADRGERLVYQFKNTTTSRQRGKTDDT